MEDVVQLEEQIQARPHIEAQVAKQVVAIRPARPADARAGAELIYLPMGNLADYLFAPGDPQKAASVLAALFRQPANRFSYQFADVAMYGNDLAGLLLAYPGRQLKRLDLPMARQLIGLYGWIGTIRFIKRAWLLMGLKETDPDDYYVYTLAVRPDLQHNGLGGQLLGHAETKGRAAGLTRCSLGVTVDNEGAIRFYRRHGYQIVETISTPRLEKRIGYKGYHRMAKRLAG